MLSVLPELIGNRAVGLFGSLRMVEFTFDSISTFFSIRAWMFFLGLWKPPQEVLQGRSIAAQRIIRRHKLVIYKGVHEQPLLDEALPLRLLPLKVPVHVVGHDYAVRLIGQLDNEAVVITDHTFACNTSRRCEHKNLFPLQVPQNVLICDWNIWPGLLLPPQGNKHGDFSVASFQEEVDSQLDSKTRENFLVPMAE